VIAGDVAVEETVDLAPGEAVGGGFDGLADAVCDGVAGGQAEEVGGAAVAVGPYGVGGLKVGQADEFARVERGVEGAEAQDLGLAAAGGCSAEAGMTVAERLITILPKLLRLGVAAKEDFGARGGPGDGAAQGAGDGGDFVGGRGVAVGEAVGALDPRPKAAVGEAVMGLVPLEGLGELALGDVGDEAKVGAGGAQGVVHVEGGEVAVVPGTAEQGREVAVAAFEGVGDGGELLGEGEEAAVGGRLLIAEGADESAGGEAGGVDAGGEPDGVDAGEEVGDEVPTGAFAAFAGVADEDDEEVEGVAGGFDHAVGAGADEVAEGGEGLKEEGCRMRFCVGREGEDDAAGGPVDGSGV
jgi:hypothetical protein